MRWQRTAVVMAAAVTAFMSGAPASGQSAAPKADDIYQIEKATEDRVWRLNKRTGEITVCRLEGERLLCIQSQEVASAPPITYEQHEAEKKQKAEEHKRLRAEDLERDLAFLDKLISGFKSLVRELMARDAAQ